MSKPPAVASPRANRQSQTCSDCGASGAKKPWFSAKPLCPTCQQVRHIINTSVDEGVRYGIPAASTAAVQRARERVARQKPLRVTLLKALDRALVKREKSKKKEAR